MDYHDTKTNDQILVEAFVMALPSKDATSFEDAILEKVYNGIHQLTIWKNKHLNIKQLVSRLNITKYSKLISDKVREVLDSNNLNMLECGCRLIAKSKLFQENKIKKEHRFDTAIFVSSAYPLHENIMYHANVPNKRKKILCHLINAGNCLANIISAYGTNITMSSACTSLSSTLSVAEQYLKAGKAKNIIILSGDNVTSPEMIDHFVNGFTEIGASATTATENKPFQPANGIIIGSGCGAILLRKIPGSDLQENDLVLVDSQTYNIAKHTLALDTEFSINAFTSFMKKYKIKPQELLYVGHDTGTIYCAETELQMLKNYFTKDLDQLTLLSVKPYLGHSMGHNVEHHIIFDLLKNYRRRLASGLKICFDGQLKQLTTADLEHRFSEIKYAMHASFGMTGNVSFTLYKINR